jgi:hypothetical protein
MQATRATSLRIDMMHICIVMLGLNCVQQQCIAPNFNIPTRPAQVAALAETCLPLSLDWLAGGVFSLKLMERVLLLTCLSALFASRRVLKKGDVHRKRGELQSSLGKNPSCVFSVITQFPIVIKNEPPPAEVDVTATAR